MKRSVLTGEALVVTAVVFFLAIMAWPMQADAPSPTGVVTHEVAHATPVGGKRLRHGFYEGFQIAGSPPSFWIYVEDDTVDGVGLEFYLFHASYIEPGPANPSVTNTLQFDASPQATNVGEAIAWIVQNNPHVNDASELLVHQHDVSAP